MLEWRPKPLKKKWEKTEEEEEEITHAGPASKSKNKMNRICWWNFACEWWADFGVWVWVWVLVWVCVSVCLKECLLTQSMQKMSTLVIIIIRYMLTIVVCVLQSSSLHSLYDFILYLLSFLLAFLHSNVCIYNSCYGLLLTYKFFVVVHYHLHHWQVACKFAIVMLFSLFCCYFFLPFSPSFFAAAFASFAFSYYSAIIC